MSSIDLSLFERVRRIYRRRAAGMQRSKTAKALEERETPEFFRELGK